jgi:hypothetical protein
MVVLIRKVIMMIKNCTLYNFRKLGLISFTTKISFFSIEKIICRGNIIKEEANPFFWLLSDLSLVTPQQDQRPLTLYTGDERE